MGEKGLDKVKNFIKTAKAPALPNNPGQTKVVEETAAGAVHDETRSIVSESSSKKPKVWHPQQEKLLKQWAEIATSFRWMHHRAHLRYARMHFWFTLPVIVMSSVTGTMNFAQGTFPPEYETYVPLLIGSVNLIAGIITTIASYLRVSELSEGNRVASIMFGKLSRNIRVELLLPISERTMDGGDFISMCRSELDRLTEQAPDIPTAIEQKFATQFEALLRTDFYPPELRDLHPVEIYTGDIERNQEQVSKVVANAALMFQKGAGKLVSPAQRELPELDDMLPPVPEVALKLPPVPTASALLAEADKTQRAQELNLLSGLQTVSNRLRNKAATARHDVQSKAKAVEMVSMLNQAATYNGASPAAAAAVASAAAAVTDELGSVVKAGADAASSATAAMNTTDVVIDIPVIPSASTFFEGPDAPP